MKIDENSHFWEWSEIFCEKREKNRLLGKFLVGKIVRTREFVYKNAIQY